jgi:Domain of unknown function (DUF4406)
VVGDVTIAKIYLGGPMTGKPYFNTPAFRKAAEELRSLGNDVFSPVERNDKAFGRDITLGYPTGDPKQLAQDEGFSLREAFLDDLTYLCKEADTLALLPGWQDSKGARAEYAVAVALGLNVIELTP